MIAGNYGGSASAASAQTDVIAVQSPRGQSGYTVAVRNDFPAGFWPMDGTSATSAADASGNGRTVTGAGTGVTTGQAGPFQNSRSYRFNTETPNGALRTAYWNVTDNFALELWVRSDQAAGGPRTPAGNGGVTSDRCPFGAWPVTSGSTMYGYAAGGCSRGVSSGSSTVFSGTTDWHYIVLTRTSGVTRLWIDSVAASTSTTNAVAHNTVVAPEYFEIGDVEGGAISQGYGGPFRGYISNVASTPTRSAAPRSPRTTTRPRASRPTACDRGSPRAPGSPTATS